MSQDPAWLLAKCFLLMGSSGGNGLQYEYSLFSSCLKQIPRWCPSERKYPRLFTVYSFIHSLQVTIKTNLSAELKHQAPN